MWTSASRTRSENYWVKSSEESLSSCSVALSRDTRDVCFALSRDTRHAKKDAGEKSQVRKEAGKTKKKKTQIYTPTKKTLFFSKTTFSNQN